MQLSFADPWNFMNGDPAFRSLSGKWRIEYGALRESGMNAPLCGAAYLVNDSERYLIDKTCAGPARWNVSGEYAAIPLYLAGLFASGMQRIAIVDPGKKELTVYQRKFRLLHLQGFDGSIITAVDSPIHQPRELLIDLSKEKVHRNKWLKAAL